MYCRFREVWTWIHRLILPVCPGLDRSGVTVLSVCPGLDCSGVTVLSLGLGLGRQYFCVGAHVPKRLAKQTIRSCYTEQRCRCLERLRL